MINLKKITVSFMIGLVAVFTMTGCTMPWDKKASNADENSATTETIASTVEELVSQVSGTDLYLTFDDEDLVSSWDNSRATTIQLNDSSASVNGEGAKADGGVVTISSSGTYVLSGNLSDGSIVVNVSEKGTVRLVLNGVTINSNSTAPIMVLDAKKVLVTIADGTTNTISDSTRSTTESEDYSAAIYSKSDLVFNGEGTLTVNAGYRNGIKSTDDLKIVSGNYNITSKEDGIIGKDLLGVNKGNFVITAGSDGMKSTYDTDSTKGNIILLDGSFEITSSNDGIQSENVLLVSGGTYQIKTGGGASNASTSSDTGNDWNIFGNRGGMQQQTTTTTTDTESMKGLKAANTIYIYGSTTTIDSEDDGIHCDGAVYIEGGSLTIQAGDDGIHADVTLTIDAGTIDIQKSYEGLEGQTITINDGTISIVASDDGINAASGSSDSQGMGFGQQTTSSSTNQLIINGGTLKVNADGDGLDANGSITLNGGTVVVEGPTSNNDTALDFDSTLTFNGGTIMAFGSSGMIETPSDATNGCCIVSTFTSVAANSIYSLTDESGNVILTYTPSKTYSAAIVYSSSIVQGNTYTVSAGSNASSVTVSSAVTGGSNSGMGGMGNMQQGGMTQPGDMQQGGAGQQGGMQNNGMPNGNQGMR